MGKVDGYEATLSQAAWMEAAAFPFIQFPRVPPPAAPAAAPT